MVTEMKRRNEEKTLQPRPSAPMTNPWDEHGPVVRRVRKTGLAESIFLVLAEGNGGDGALRRQDTEGRRGRQG